MVDIALHRHALTGSDDASLDQLVMLGLAVVRQKSGPSVLFSSLPWISLRERFHGVIPIELYDLIVVMFHKADRQVKWSQNLVAGLVKNSDI